MIGWHNGLTTSTDKQNRILISENTAIKEWQMERNVYFCEKDYKIIGGRRFNRVELRVPKSSN